jgi:8-oxo-dGTP diphosphatase
MPTRRKNPADPARHQSDPVAWAAHLAEANAWQARKRVSADLLLTDTRGRLLLVDPSYKSGWDLPGGMAEANETPECAARRELFEELGISVQPSRLLCLDWVAPHGPWDDLLAFIFDGGRLTNEEANRLSIHDAELPSFEFCTVEQSRQRLRPHVWRRTRQALRAVETGHSQYLHDGCQK